jgi:glycosyltransferase involved in cell wall biosynthesis
MFGKVVGYSFVFEDLGIREDDTPDTVTLSIFMETYHSWPAKFAELSKQFRHVQLCTMFETSDVHPDIVRNMRLFHKIIVPNRFLQSILKKYDLPVVSLNTWTSPLIRSLPKVVPKPPSNALTFLYVGSNDIRKNLVQLTHVFHKVLHGDHKLIVKTNRLTNLARSANIVYIQDRLNLDQMAALYNQCDYVVSFTRGEGVGLPMLEAKYFNKPVICHDKGVFADHTEPWIVLPAQEVSINYSLVPPFLHKVFYGSWWQVDEHKAAEIIGNLLTESN